MYKFEIKADMEVTLIPMTTYYKDFKFEVEQSVSDWFNDLEVTKYNSHGQYFYNKHKLIYENLDDDTSQLVFAILVSDNSDPMGIILPKYVGNVALQEIDLINRKAEIAILLGEKEYWGKGIATGAYECMIEHGFDRLNLHKLYSGCIVDGAMSKVCTSVNMDWECTFFDEVFFDGIYRDIERYVIFQRYYFE